MRDYYDVVIAGSGPAGLAAACSASASGNRVLLAERLDSPARKLLASGGTRCNFANVLDDENFMSRFGRTGRFMTDALKFMPLEKMISFFETRGVPSETPDDFHYFPSSGKAADILDALRDYAVSNGTEIVCSSEITSVILENDAVAKVVFADGKIVSTKKLILACGGNAMPQLGGTAKGLELAASLAHKIIEPLPAMANLCVSQQWMKSLSGVSLNDVRITLLRKRNSINSRGTLLFTHDGLSGNAAIDISGEAHKDFSNDGKASLTLSFDASKTFADWVKIVSEFRTSAPKKFVRSSIAVFFTHSLADAVLTECGFYEKRNFELTKNDIERIALFLSEAPFELEKLCPMTKAMAMKGGVSLKEVDPKTLESRLVKGVFFAGEILDLDGPCGGYNIRFALSSGFLAGRDLK